MPIDLKLVEHGIEKLKQKLQKSDRYCERVSIWINYLLVLRNTKEQKLPNLDELLFNFVREKMTTGEIDRDQLQKAVEKRSDRLALTWLSSQLMLRLGGSGILIWNSKRCDSTNTALTEVGCDRNSTAYSH